MILYIDMGNSRIKLLVGSDNLATDPVINNDYSDSDWLDGVNETPDQIVALNVADSDAAMEMQQRCIQRWGKPVQWLQSTASSAGLHNAYSVPEHLGVDRWAAMAGAHARYSGDLIVADFGTATTVDAVTSQGQHLGGWIVPGIDAMRGLQRQRLPHLFRPGAESGKVVSLASSTVDALESGVLQPQAGMLERFSRLAIDSGLSEPIWIVTGGQAETMMSLLAQAAHVEPRLVFYGMQALAGKS